MDAIDSARERFEKFAAIVDANCARPPDSEYASAILSDASLKDVGMSIAAHDALKSRAEFIKVQMREQTIGAAEKTLSDFQRENRGVLSKLPKLQKAAEPPFTPTQLQPDHYSGESAKLVAKGVTT
jgi:hypothetical protein